jgi:hypothetical protein
MGCLDPALHSAASGSASIAPAAAPLPWPSAHAARRSGCRRPGRRHVAGTPGLGARRSALGGRRAQGAPACAPGAAAAAAAAGVPAPTRGALCAADCATCARTRPRTSGSAARGRAQSDTLRHRPRTPSARAAATGPPRTVGYGRADAGHGLGLLPGSPLQHRTAGGMDPEVISSRPA